MTEKKLLLITREGTIDSQELLNLCEKQGVNSSLIIGIYQNRVSKSIAISQIMYICVY